MGILCTIIQYQYHQQLFLNIPKKKLLFLKIKKTFPLVAGSVIYIDDIFKKKL